MIDKLNKVRLTIEGLEFDEKQSWIWCNPQIVHYCQSRNHMKNQHFIWNRGKHEWLDVCLGLGCHTSEDNTNHALFLNSNKCCWKAASSVIKNSSNSTKTTCYFWLACLNYSTTYCCRQHPMCLKTRTLKLLLENIDCHCLLFVIYDFSVLLH